MFNIKKEIYKLSNIMKDNLCPELMLFPAGVASGIYFFEVELGTGVGEVYITYSNVDEPRRIIVNYDGSVVADSLYIGNDFVGDPPNYGGTFVGTNYPALEEYDYVNGSFVLNGNTQNITINQINVQTAGNTSGNGTISFTKFNSSPTTALIAVYNPVVGKSFTVSVSCPTNEPPATCYEFQLVSNFEQNIFFNYIDCEGNPDSITLNNESTTICAQSVELPANPTNQWSIDIGLECTV